MATSTISNALAGLIAILRASSGLRGIEIIDGQPTTNTPKDFVAVGYSENGAAISGGQEPATLGNLRRSETYDIACQVSAWTGSTDIVAVRERAFTLFAAVETAVRNDATLNGAVIFSDIGSIDVSQYQTEQGAVVDIDFTVAVKIVRI